MSFPSAVDDTPAYSDKDGPPARPDDEILEEIRERRTYGGKAWEMIRDDGRKDVLCAAGQPWQALDPGGLKQRLDAVRPALALDELGQYLNQVGNDVRQNKRGVKVTPIGNGANDKTAQFRQALMRQIEYRSNAQRDVYSPIFEDCLTRGYGFGRLVAKYTSDTSRDQELITEAFPNPDVVLPDPDGAMLSPDCSKIQWCFVMDSSRTRKAFKREFPNAEITDFADEHVRVAPDWIQVDRVTLAEYWTIEHVNRRVVFLKIAPERGFLLPDALKSQNGKPPLMGRPPDKADIAFERIVPVPYVCQYLTNGLELLAKPGQKKRTPWPGRSIPIFSCFGKVIYVPTESGTERRLMSMVRLARDPYMLYCYIRSCEAEMVGMTPKFPYFWYDGSLTPEAQLDLQKSLHEPIAGIKVKPFPEQFSPGGTGPAPFPSRQPYEPALVGLEAVAEAARRAIQAAMGTSPLPTEAQIARQDSGKALALKESSGQKGSFHFVDHLDGMIVRVGQLEDEQITFRYDAKRKVTIRKPNDQSEEQAINDPSDPDSVDATIGDHDITISVGPAKESERQEANDFSDTIITNQPLMETVGPEKASKLIAQAIRLKDVGPIGDEMAEIIDPKPPEGEEPVSPQVADLQAQLQQAQQLVQEAQTALETDQAKQQAQVETARIKAETDTATAAADVASKQADADLKMLIARLDAETKLEIARMQEETKREIARAQLAAKAVQIAASGAEAEAGRDHESAEAAEARAAAAEGSEAERVFAAEQADLARASDAARAEA